MAITYQREEKRSFFDEISPIFKNTTVSKTVVTHMHPSETETHELLGMIEQVLAVGKVPVPSFQMA
eukprot:2591723-Ditylum_brightwellii.AAC.1